MIAETFKASDLAYVAPLLTTGLGGILVLLLEAFAVTRGSKKWLMWISLAVCGLGLLSVAWLARWMSGNGGLELFSGMLIADRFSLFFSALFLTAALLTLLVSSDYLKEHYGEHGEYYPLVLLATCGMMILASAGDLVMVFLGVETMSLAVYVLVGMLRRSKASAEAAMKYFLTGAFATAFLLYGIALVYGVAGTTNLRAIGANADKLATEPVFLAGELLIIVAFGFKVAAVPFHMWAPDAYEGAPTPITAFMAAGVKAAAIAGVLRLFLTAFGGEMLPFGTTGWGTILGVLAALTMTLGNIAALRQENIKRLLAYSSIAHAGYILVGVVAAGLGARNTSVPALLFYLVAYTFTTMGAFAVLIWLGRRGDERVMVEDWAGLAASHPGCAAAMTIFLLSLAGMPPTAGFVGKFYVFRAALAVPNDALLWLVIVAVLNSVASVYYYLRVVKTMYFREPARTPQPLSVPTVTAAIVVCTLLVMGMGLLPGRWLDAAISSVMMGA